MLNKPYKGDENYIFISYSHRNIKEVLEFIEVLQNNGYNVWYDEGIDPGAEWDENIAKHIEGCAYFIAFVTKEYIDSQNCRDELSFARDLDKERLLIYAEDVDLPKGMQMRLNRLQAIYKHKYADPKEFYNKVFEAQAIDTCKIGENNKSTTIEVVSPKELKQEKTGNSKLIIIVIGVIVCIALVISLVVFMNSGKTSGDDEISSASSEEMQETNDESAEPTEDIKEDLKEANIVLVDNNNVSVSIVSYEDSKGVFAVKIKNKTNDVISSFQDGDSVLLDGSKQCISETSGTHSFAYIDVPAKGETTVFCTFRENADDGWDTILRLSENHTFEFVMDVVDSDYNTLATYNVKLTPDMFDY